MHEAYETDKAPAEQQHTITITANGSTRVLPVGSTVEALLNSLNITARYVVVQLDGAIIPRPDYASTVLQPGCKLEIITMVGGG